MLLVPIRDVEAAAASRGRERRAAREAGKKLAVEEPDAAGPDMATATQSQRRRRHGASNRKPRRQRVGGFGRKRVDLG